MSYRNDNNDFPFVSALLVTWNEQDYIELALKSYVEQDYPKNRYEIIVVDGGSTDKTLEIVEKIKVEFETDVFRIYIMDNPKRILASGWNIGIKAAKGDYVIRIDAHARAYPDFLRKSVETMEKVNAACVGGKLITRTIQGNNDTISKVLSSPFGVGNSSFRVSNEAGFVDTAVYGLYKKRIFSEVGYFNENYKRNQDLQMHSRIRKAGYKFYFNPKIRSEYFARNTIRKMIKQAFENGKWNVILMKEDYKALSIRHLIPFVFVSFIVLTSIFGFQLRPIWFLEIAILALYFILGIIFGIMAGAKGIEIITMPFLFLLLHSSYGTGFLVGMFRKKRDKEL